MVLSWMWHLCCESGLAAAAAAHCCAWADGVSTPRPHPSCQRQPAQRRGGEELRDNQHPEQPRLPGAAAPASQPLWLHTTTACERPVPSAIRLPRRRTSGAFRRSTLMCPALSKARWPPGRITKLRGPDRTVRPARPVRNGTRTEILPGRLAGQEPCLPDKRRALLLCRARTGVQR